VPRAAFTFTSMIRNPQLRPILGLKHHKGTDLAAKMAESQVSDAKQPPRTAPDRPAQVLPNAAFTFTPPSHSLQPTPIFGLEQRKSVDVAAKMADLRVSDEDQPRRTVQERPEHVLPSVAFPFTTPRGSQEPVSTWDFKFGATRPTDAQNAPAKTLPAREEHGLPTAAFSFTTPNRSGGSGSVPGVEAGVTRPTDAQQTTKTLAAEALDKTDRRANIPKLDPRIFAAYCSVLLTHASSRGIHLTL
jgi:hypothetical protein